MKFFADTGGNKITRTGWGWGKMHRNGVGTSYFYQVIAIVVLCVNIIIECHHMTGFAGLVEARETTNYNTKNITHSSTWTMSR